MFNMNINFKFLFLGTTLSLIPNLLYAQCAETDCLKLGYNKLQKCDNGLKCPFGEYWACPKVEEKAIFGQCTGYAKNCKIADILYHDGTCSPEKVNSKIPIGVVVYISPDNCGQAIALDPITKEIWSYSGDNIFELQDYGDEKVAIKDFDSCGNSYKIENYVSVEAPLLQAVKNYAPSSLPETKGKWCIPAAGVVFSFAENVRKINSVMKSLGKQECDNYSYGHGYIAHIYSSTEFDADKVWAYYCSNSYPYMGPDGKNGTNATTGTYPVIEF